MVNAAKAQLITRRVRFVSAIPTNLVLMICALAAPMILALVSVTNAFSSKVAPAAATTVPDGHPLLFYVIWGSIGVLILLIALSIFVIVVQTKIAYRKKTYDYTLALKYQDRFESQDFAKGRISAAKATISYIEKGDWKKVENVSDVEYVLDFFDDLGFYLQGCQVSDEVLHHHFYNWVRIYLQPGISYISNLQKENNEPKLWEYCEVLLHRLSAIEIGKSDFMPSEVDWSQDKLKEYLRHEVELAA